MITKREMEKRNGCKIDSDTWKKIKECLKKIESSLTDNTAYVVCSSKNPHPKYPNYFKKVKGLEIGDLYVAEVKYDAIEVEVYWSYPNNFRLYGIVGKNVTYPIVDVTNVNIINLYDGDGLSDDGDMGWIEVQVGMRVFDKNIYANAESALVAIKKSINDSLDDVSKEFKNLLERKEKLEKEAILVEKLLNKESK